MGWKDLMKNVTDKATSVAETAQAKFEEQKQLSAIKKEEQNKKMEEMNERVTEYEQELLQNILSGFSGAPCIEVEDNILDFTKDYFEKLLLPANSVSASKITMYPYSDKIQKKAQKALREYDDTETPVFQFEGNLQKIPNEYKKYSKFKAKIKLYKEELQKAISLEKKFRKKYDKLNDPYKEGKVDEYLEIANEWKEEIDKEFPATSEDSYEANLKSYLNDIFLSTLSPYLTATLDSSKLGDGENPYADLQKEQEEREQENTETFTPSGSEGGKPEDVVIYNPQRSVEVLVLKQELRML